MKHSIMRGKLIQYPKMNIDCGGAGTLIRKNTPYGFLKSDY